MKMTNKLIVIFTAALSLFLLSTSVWAGSSQRHRWEGVAIVAGAAIAGTVLINRHAIGYHNGPVVSFGFGHPSRHRYFPGDHTYRKFRDGRRHKIWRPYIRGNHYHHYRQNGSCNRHRYWRHGYSNHRKPYGSQRFHNHGHAERRYYRY